MALASYVITFSLVFFHEMAHGFSAIILGGYFPFVHLDISSGNAVYIFPIGSPIWKDVIVLLAGPFVNLLLAVTMLGLVATGIKNRQLELLAILIGELSALAFIIGTGLITPWQPGSGDVARALSLANLPRVYAYIAVAIWLLLGLTIIVSLSRLFFRKLGRFFSGSTYLARLLLIASAIALPALIIIGLESLPAIRVGGAGNESASSRESLYLILLLLSVSFLLPLVIRAGDPEQEKQRFRVSPRQLAFLLIAASSIAVIQTMLFGNVDSNPPGLFLSSKPPEITVSACNIRMSLDEGYRARVRVLMRPFVDRHRFLWDRIKDMEPEDWSYYDQFVRHNLPLMLGTDKYEVTARYADAQAPFFNGVWDRGARIIEAEVDLSQMPHLKGSESGRVLKIVDFWRARGIGYLDFAEIKLEGKLQIGAFKSRPDGASEPIFRSDKLLQWENSNLEKSFAVSYIAIK
jgi:hypothetical protein